MSERHALRSRIVALIEDLSDGSRDDDTLDALLDELAEYQTAQVAAYGRLVDSYAKRPGGRPPALPTDVFRFERIASYPEAQDARIFRTSGTTQDSRGAHHFTDLALYDLAARTFARRMLFPDRGRLPLIMLAPHEDELPDSSLSYMLSRFAEWFGEGDTRWVYREGALDLEALEGALSDAEKTGEAVALLGTSFAFVHADDALEQSGRRARLPGGSRIMQTGGFKGRSRVVEPAAMRAMLAARYDIPEALIISEYGMTELSSQMYETTLRETLLENEVGPRRLAIPGWVRATPVDPESLGPVQSDAVGILRIDDAANLDSVSAIQTSDLARRVDGGIEVLGRAEGAVPRGCSIAVDAALGGR